MRRTKALRKLLERKGIIVAPGAYDALSAKLIEEAGFNALYITGSGISHSDGWPDIGLVTLTEMIDRVAKIVDATALPAIADADTGYGNAINLMRAVRLFERAGVAAIHIEDQITPKRCGHYEGKAVVSKEEMVKKVRAALEAREDADFLIIARTDARAVYGFEEAVERGRAYREAGADVIFLEAPQTLKEWEEVPKLIEAPLLANMVIGGKSPALTAQELEALGYKIAIFSSDPQRAAIAGMRDVLKELKEKGTTEHFPRMVTFEERGRIIGLPKFRELEERFLRL